MLHKTRYKLDAQMVPTVQWHVRGRGIRHKTAIKQDGDGVAFTVLDLSSFASLVSDSSPWFDPSFLAFVWLLGVLQYFLDLKTPASAGSAPAHQIYKPNADVICLLEECRHP
ncbi:hypothetical protein HanXRQr2_Chr17g0796541 [Helianthus annuus]|uniref:Uncharacterized protein n=1 Tax=Helianthus annuus TaxID=4232 RepID=A0A9K3DGF5_HELAN|nr:hypothetical protein HanXRQr2_Chr17g0796541 [Helianthus annuus]KAJ0812644.1 hypothetical protein HanPSC8_Chr17g0764251 [Helianthus annuus]